MRYRFGGVEELQEQGCVALRNLSLNDGNSMATAKAKGIGSVLVGMGVRTPIVEAQKSGCAALGNLSSDNERAARRLRALQWRRSTRL
jgi:hypothetical protein